LHWILKKLEPARKAAASDDTHFVNWIQLKFVQLNSEPITVTPTVIVAVECEACSKCSLKLTRLTS